MGTETTQHLPSASGRLEERLPGLWLSLLAELTADVPDWFTMKGVGSALTGTGDVDSIAPVDTWVAIKDIFHAWAASEGLGPVVFCPHAPYLLHIVALSELRPEVFELDVNSRKIFFGSTLFRPADVAGLAVMDPLGYRRLRPGAEGVLKLLQNGSSRTGRPIREGLDAKKVVELLRSDPEGAQLFGDRFQFGASSMTKAVDAAIAGEWDRLALALAKLSCLARAALEPDAVVARLRFRWQRNHCPVLHTVVSGQRRVESPSTWLREVAESHEVRL